MRDILPFFIPILALAIPVAAVIMNGWSRVWKLRVEEARLRVQGGDASVIEELQALRGEVDGLRGELSELHERVDFAERLLTRGRDEEVRKG